MQIRLIILGVTSLYLPACAAQITDKSCKSMRVDAADYMVCKFDPATHNVGLHLRDADGEIYGNFDPFIKPSSKSSSTPIFAMNGGMYHNNRDPVGLYIEDGIQVQAISTKPGEGNFHMLPNGVFWIESTDADGEVFTTARVLESKRYMADSKDVSLATQSGPMLVINGELHPRFIKDSESRKIRNGVGIAGDGTLIFVISDTPVNFYQFSSLFRDTLQVNNALYLDGTISRLYSKGLRRNDKGLPMGPIISVTESLPRKAPS